MPDNFKSMYNPSNPITRGTKGFRSRRRRQPTIQRYGVSLVEAARRLCVEQSNLFIALQKGQIPTIRRNGQTLVSNGALKEYQSRKRLGATFRY